MAKKSDYAIVIVCTPGYGFGMISTMNAQNYFKTDADWEIAYEGYEPEYMERISNTFNFNVNWTPVSELMKKVVDKRTNKKGELNRFWLSYWLLAHKLLKEKKYKAVCVIQADSFIFVNLDVYFKIAAAGVLICSEHAFSYINADDLPFGNEKGVWDRSMCGVFDAINFMGQGYTDLPIDTVHFQEEDAFKGESNHSVSAFNRSVCKHGKKDNILGLDRRIWVCDSIWPHTKLKLSPNGFRVFNDHNIQLRGWHCRWWQEGRVISEWRNNKENIIKNYNDNVYMNLIINVEHNYNLVKSFMEKFNNMSPGIKSEEYVKGVMERPKFEIGEELK